MQNSFNAWSHTLKIDWRGKIIGPTSQFGNSWTLQKAYTKCQKRRRSIIENVRGTKTAIPNAFGE